jgi:hypothetical protein
LLLLTRERILPFWVKTDLLHERRVKRRIVCWTMLCLWLGIYAASVCPQLHHLLHADSQSDSHACVINQLGKSIPIVGSCTTVAIEVIQSSFYSVHILDCLSFSKSDCQLPAGRAPPSIVSLLPVVVG